MKDGRSDSLAAVPERWETANLRFLLRSLDQGWSPSALDHPAADEEWGVLKLSAVDEGIFHPEENKTLPEGVAADSRLEVSDGDVLLTRANTPTLVGDACYVQATRPGLMISDLIYRLRFSERLNPRFATYWLISPEGRQQIETDARGSSQSMVKVSQSHIRSWQVPVPPLIEQAAIANFLDRETAKIDALIDQKQRLIELLQEKRAALITEAVSKGLDPNVKLRESGVDWLGEIPEHWNVVKLGWLASVGNGSTPSRGRSEYWEDGTIPWLTSSKINDQIIDQADQWVTRRATRDCHLPMVPEGSVLIALTGEGQTRGRAAILRMTSSISQHLAYITPERGDLVGPFLWRFLQSQYERLRYSSGGTGSTRAALTCGFVRSLLVPVPPVSEQTEICAHLRTVNDKLDEVLRTVRCGVALFGEYRTALISAAVTGKIDVRESAA